MTVLSAQSIRFWCQPRSSPVRLISRPGADYAPPSEGMLHPFTEREVHAGSGTSGGLSAASYDLHIRRDLVLWPGRFALASTVERFSMPHHVMAIVHDKSSLARRGLSVFNTLIDPGWRGWLTLELRNQGWSFIRLQAGQPVCQVVFHRLDEPTSQPYVGKYQDQPDNAVPALREGAVADRHCPHDYRDWDDCPVCGH